MKKLRAYYRDDAGLLTISYVVQDCQGDIWDKHMCEVLERTPDESVVELMGWPDREAVSYNRGRVLVTSTQYVD